MSHIDLSNNQTPMNKQKTSAFTWIIASIIFHLLILLTIMTYKFNLFEQEHTKLIRSDDHVVLWTQQPTPAPQQVQVQPEPKQEEKKQEKLESKNESPKKMPIIIPGKQGIDEQNLDGSQHVIQYPQETSQKPQDNFETTPEEIITNQQPIKNEPLYTTSPLVLPKGNIFISSIPTQNSHPKKPEEKLNEQKSKTTMYQHVPKPSQQKPIKTISFQDLGLGQNNNLTTFGNSAHMGIQGDSPDIPTGEELKYITYLNQMATMIVNSLHANPQKNLIPRRTYEEVVFHVKVNRTGHLLTTKIIKPSKHEIINVFILDSVKLVGLFNPLPKFITKDTFEINWRISM